MDSELFERYLARERAARRQAEHLLETKSRELYEANLGMRRYAAALRAQSTRFQTILQTAAEGIITFTETGLIQTANPAAERTFGYDCDELTGMRIGQLVPDGMNPRNDQRPCLANDFWTNLPTTLCSVHLAHGLRKDGSQFDMELAGSFDDAAESRLFIWTVRDITYRRALERQLGLSQKMESVGQLAAGIAHEINTPIQYIGDNAKFLDAAFRHILPLIDGSERLLAAVEATPQLSDVSQEYHHLLTEADWAFWREEIPLAVAQTIEGTQRVAKIVTAMKEFSHPGSQQKTQVDLNRAILSTVTVSRNEWKYVCQLETLLAENLPLVPCLPGDLSQALLNLIINASHAVADRHAHDESGRIEIRSRWVDDFAEISITDNGTGIPPEVLPKIFDPFFTTKPFGRGTGQGLAIVYNIIVEKHHGAIDVQTVVGQGTTFILRLPLHLHEAAIDLTRLPANQEDHHDFTDTLCR